MYVTVYVLFIGIVALYAVISYAYIIVFYIIYVTV